MYKYILFAALVALAVAAPAPEPKPLHLISDLKTPASTAKLTPLAPISHITYSAPALPYVAPSAYVYSAPLLPAGPTSYSIEQHGYNIVY